jgi:hypothetical protein
MSRILSEDFARLTTTSVEEAKALMGLDEILAMAGSTRGGAKVAQNVAGGLASIFGKNKADHEAEAKAAKDKADAAAAREKKVAADAAALADRKARMAKEKKKIGGRLARNAAANKETNRARTAKGGVAEETQGEIVLDVDAELAELERQE